MTNRCAGRWQTTKSIQVSNSVEKLSRGIEWTGMSSEYLDYLDLNYASAFFYEGVIGVNFTQFIDTSRQSKLSKQLLV